MKRFLCAAFFIALVALFVACGKLNTNNTAQAAATPTSSTSRTARSEPVQVNQTVANTAVTGETNHSANPSATATAGTAAQAVAETPATGDFPVMYLAGVIGLIFLCSGGLLMLRKI